MAKGKRSLKKKKAGKKSKQEITALTYVPPKSKDDWDSDALDLKEITTSLDIAIDRRQTVVRLLKKLESAWKEAAGPNIALNKPLPGQELPKTDTRRKVLLDAGKKKRRIEEFQQKIFLKFQELTDGKNNQQVRLGKRILSLVKKYKNRKKGAESSKGDLSKNIEMFFSNEDRLNKNFLSGIKKLNKAIPPLLLEVQKIKRMRCSDKITNDLLTQEVTVLENFLETTKELFKK